MALSLAVVAIAGVFLAVRANFDPAQGPARLIFGFEAVIIGGLGSLWGTLAGGLILGVAQAIGAHIDPGWQVLAGHIAFLVVLAVRPQGLFPKVRSDDAVMSVRVVFASRSSRDRRGVVCALLWQSSPPRRSGAAATICSCCRKSTPMSLWQACGICSPAMPASFRSASRPMSGSAPMSCSRSPSSPAFRRYGRSRSRASAAAVVVDPGGGFGVPAARALFRHRHLDRGRGVPARRRAGFAARRRLRHQPARRHRHRDRAVAATARLHHLLDRACACRRGRWR